MNSIDKHSHQPTHEHAGNIKHSPDTSEHIDRLRQSQEHESQPETDRKKETAHAEQEAMAAASQAEQLNAPPHQETTPTSYRHVTRKQLDHEFDQTMSHIHQEMSPSERTFSKVIHNKVVEKTSDALATTIARPNVLLAGSIGGFALTLGLYIFAKTVGYPLSGFEPIAAFIVGWIIGFLYDYLRVMITGRRSE